MKTLILAASAAAITLIAGAASAQPYGYDRGYSYNHGYVAPRFADRDRDGIPDRYDRHDNRRDRWAREHRYHRDWRYERDHRW
jgi:hypothetical protein